MSPASSGAAVNSSGRITVIRSNPGVEARGAVVAITSTAMRALDAIRSAGVYTERKVFGLSESQITRRVKAAGLADWENFSGHSGRAGMAHRMAQNGAPHPRDRASSPSIRLYLPKPLSGLTAVPGAVNRNP